MTREPSWHELLDLDWEAEWTCIEADWARVWRDIEGGGGHGQGHQDPAGEVERPARGPERGANEG